MISFVGTMWIVVPLQQRLGPTGGSQHEQFKYWTSSLFRSLLYLEKCIFPANWKNGKPSRQNGVKFAFCELMWYLNPIFTVFVNILQNQFLYFWNKIYLLLLPVINCRKDINIYWYKQVLFAVQRVANLKAHP